MNSTFLRSGIAAAAVVSVAACGGAAQTPHLTFGRLRWHPRRGR